MKIVKNIKEERITTISGIVLILISIVDKWYFKSFTSEVLNISVQVWGILLGFGLLIMKDTIVTAIKNKLLGK
jgi:uncharacterized membrane protein YkgB